MPGNLLDDNDGVQGLLQGFAAATDLEITALYPSENLVAQGGETDQGGKAKRADFLPDRVRSMPCHSRKPLTT